MVYISTKNFKYPKGFPRKFIPKYEGPYRIIKDYGNNSFQVDILKNMKKQGIHDVFYAALLRIHKPNDNQLFPGRLDEQVMEPEVNEWMAEQIVALISPNSLCSLKLTIFDDALKIACTIAHHQF